MDRRVIRIGTRSSRLARVQVDLVCQALRQASPALASKIEIVPMVSDGDKNRKETLEAVGGRGIFTSDVDQALISGDIDIAVHSVKDLPSKTAEGLIIQAMLEREDPREALVSSRYASLGTLPQNAVMGSASQRRMAFLRHIRPDIEFALLRGNVEERVAALESPSYDGTILAVAGLKRLGMQSAIRQIFSVDVIPPDPGQGAIGVVCRSDDFILRQLLAFINHPATYEAVSAERAMLSALGNDRLVLVGALARVDGRGDLTLTGTLITEDGQDMVRRSAKGTAESATEIGISVAEQLLAASRMVYAA